MTQELFYPAVAPYLSVADGHGALAFYVSALGAEIAQTYEFEGKIGHASLMINGGVVMLAADYPEYAAITGVRPPAALGGTTVTINLSVDDVDAWHDRAVAAGAEALRAPQDEAYGRHAKIRDPYGHVWGFVGFGQEPF